jgi:hypothetical protein
MKNIQRCAASILVFLLPLISVAQDISTHIPKRSTYIVTINPAKHIANGDAAQVGQLEMFTRTNEYGASGFNYLYGDGDLDEDRRTAFSKLFSDIFSNPQITGIDTTRRIFIFNDTPDSVHYWAYLLPISNGTVFGEYVTSKLFSKKPEVNKGSGFSAVNAERLSIGWTNSYAIILLADYDYSIQSENYYDLFRQADSTAVAVAAAEEYALQSDSVISDSIRASRTAELAEAAAEMEKTLANDSTPEEEVIVSLYDYNWPEFDNVADLQRDSSIMNLVARQLNYLINLSYEESAQSIPQFRTVQSEPADAVYWYNYGELMQQQYARNFRLRRSYSFDNPTDTTMIHNMWEGSFVASLIRFEGNVATMDQRMYFTPALHQQTKGLYSGRVDRKMFRYVRGENLMGFVAMSVDMEKFMKFYGSVYREMLQNSFLGMYGEYYLTMWDIMRVFIDEKTMYNMFDGDFLFAVTDLKPYTSSYITYDYDENFNKTETRKERTEVRPEFIFIAGLGEQAKVEQIVQVLARVNAVKQQNQEYYLINTPGEYDVKVFLAIQNGMLIVTNNEELMLKNLKRGYKRKSGIGRKLRRLGRKSPLVAWWNGKKSFELIKKNKQDESLDEENKKSLDILEHDVNSGTIVGKRSRAGYQRIEVKVELNPAEDGKKQTSFVRFFRLLNSLFLVRTNTTD